MDTNNRNGNPIKEERLNRAYRKTWIEHWQIIGAFLMLYDALVDNVSFFLGLLMRFDFHFSQIRLN